MGPGLIIAIIVVVLLLLLGLGALVLHESRSVFNTTSPRPGGPDYRHDLGRVQYSNSQEILRPVAEEGRAEPRHADLRRNPLPRCESCGTALAYGDAACSKCGWSKAPAVEKVI